ncbi:MAG: uracil-DNA glycosylase [Thermoprotei archaeon]|nr:MAG: uracil-DNA glycosylase [Thermoprotei archaeon]
MAVSLDEIARQVEACRKCGLWKSRTRPVVGEGSLDPKIMFIGEAPGRNEDLQGRPFIGAAGKLLTELLRGIGLTRDDVYITNVLKCRPPGNRDPLPEEVEACTPYLDEQVKLLRPRIIVTLGRFSTFYAFSRAGLTFTSMVKVRGKIFKSQLLGLRVSLMPTYHPAAALYYPKLKEPLIKDFEKLKKELEGLDSVDESRTISLSDFM